MAGKALIAWLVRVRGFKKRLFSYIAPYVLVLFCISLVIHSYHKYVLDSFVWSLKVEDLRQSYDYIIVGGGTAGCVLAARLVDALPHATVLLIEAGGGEYSPALWSHVPLAAPALQRRPLADWQYVTAPQRHAAHGLHDSRMRWPRGKLLGGSSVLNYMIGVHASAADYARWPPPWDDYGSAVLPYMRRVERRLFGDAPIARQRLGDAQVQFMQAMRPTGIGRNANKWTVDGDYNGEAADAPGMHRCQWTVTAGGRRASAVRQYLRPAAERHPGRLHVLTRALATQIVFDQTNTEAVAVKLMHNGEEAVVNASREVIVCAGAVESPKLLMLSGIGPSGDLQKHNIPVIKDMRMVGENLMDHLLMILNYDVDGNTGQEAHMSATKHSLSLAHSLAEYIFMGSGVLSRPPISTLGFITTGLLPAGYDRDVQLYGFVGDIIGGEKYLHLSNIRQEVYNHSWSLHNATKHKLTMGVCLNHPMSRGHIKLSSANPHSHPIIQPNYLQHPADMQMLLRGYTRETRQAVISLLRGSHSQSVQSYSIRQA